MSSSTRTRTILLVEDSLESRDVYSTALEACGYTVIQAADGAEGIRLATESPPDMVIMNVSMPHVNGVDAVEILKAHPATEHVPILVVTGHGGTPSVRDGAWEAGCDDFLSKPLVPSELVSAVEKCLKETRFHEKLAPREVEPERAARAARVRQSRG